MPAQRTAPRFGCGLIPAMRAPKPSRRPTRLGSVAIMALAAFTVGCSSSGHSTTTTVQPDIKSLSDLRVTRKEIAAAGRNSPSAALLTWWRAMQTGHVRLAREAYAKPVNTAGVPNEVKRLDYFLIRSRPDIRKVETKDGTARLTTLVNAARFSTSNPSDVLVVLQTPTTFRLDREAGKWRLADDDYLEQLFRAEISPTK